MLNKVRNILWILSISSLLLFGCKKDELIGNQAPETKLSVDSINLTGNNRLNSTIRLSWYGTDIDGYVTNYEYSINNGDWIATNIQDSTFKFSIDAGSDTTDILFKVRAIDDKGVKDPTPAMVSIPLKNAPPQVTIEQESFPIDTTNLALTFRWRYADPDGDNTVTKAFIKVNAGSWIEIERNKSLITLIATNTKNVGTGDAQLYYNVDNNPSAVAINSFNNGGNNTIYLKVLDIAGSESKIDTSKMVFVKPQTSDMLFLNGQNATIANAYQNLISKAGKSYDYIDLGAGGGKYLPRFWNPTYRLLTSKYKLLFINSDQGLFTNTANGNAGLLLEFLAPVLQNFTDNGGKSFITTSFPSGYDLVNIKGAFPIDSISNTSGQAVVASDSNIYNPTGLMPTLSPKNLVLGVDPFVPSVDALVIYRARTSAFGAWKGPNVVGVKRMVAGKARQVFFSVELHLFNADNTKLENLFSYIFNTELND
jgi:hypothetical protein